MPEFNIASEEVPEVLKNWKRKANIDLWLKLDKLANKRVVLWEWVRAHEGNFYNEKAHNLAYTAAMSI